MDKDEYIKELERLLKLSMEQTDRVTKIAKKAQEQVMRLLTPTK